jgi:hypothetical protein
MATLLNSSQKNINALKLKIQQQKTLLNLNKDDLFLSNIIKTNQNTLNYLQNKKPMHELITLNSKMKCGITGTIIDKGEQAYYNHQTKTCIHPLVYERNMQQTKIGEPKTYFTRLQKLNK